MENKKVSSSKLRIVVFLIVGSIIALTIYFMFQKPTIDMNIVNDVFKEDTCANYFYNQLGEEDKEDYKRIYYALSCADEDESVPLHTKVKSKISQLLTKVMDDHPEFYYTDTDYYWFEDNGVLMFSTDLLFEKEEIKKYNQKIEEETKDIIEKAKKEKTDINKAKILYQYVIDSVEYKENKNDQNMMSSIVEKKSVCAGYAKEYQYLLTKVGIESTYINGMALDEGKSLTDDNRHAWIMMKLDGDYYYSDPTWGDIVEKESKHPCMTYFVMNSDEMLKNYKPEVGYEKTKENKLNYFQNIGCFMTSYDKNMLSKAVKMGKQNKTYVAEIKCANNTVYKRLLKALDDEYLGYEVLSKNGCWKENTTYSWNDDMKTIELYYK